MNCFCYPDAAAQIFERLLPSLVTGRPEFGVAGKVPLQDRTPDATELDMRAGSVIFESKLTEADFTSRPHAHVKRYSWPKRDVRRDGAFHKRHSAIGAIS